MGESNDLSPERKRDITLRKMLMSRFGAPKVGLGEVHRSEEVPPSAEIQ